MAKKSAILLIFSALALTALVFQNCANPAPYDRRSSSSGGGSQLDNPADTTPRMTRPDQNDDFTPPDLSQPLPRFVQDSSTNADERTRGIVQTSDGGFITTGFARDDPNDNVTMDVLFKKFDRDGVLVYSRRIGDGYENQAYKALEMPDAYVVAGLTRTIVDAGEGRSADVMLVRINKDNGDVIETFRYGTTDIEALHDIIYTRDNNGDVLVGVGYHIDRSTNIKSALVVKFDSGFNIIWSNRFMGGSDPLVLQSLAYIPNGGYYAVGFRDRTQNQDSFLIRFSYAGALLGARLLNNTGSQDDLRDVGYDGTDLIAVGRLNGNGRGGEGAIHRFDLLLNHKSTHIVGTPGSLERFMDLNTHPDGSLILAGLSDAGGDVDNWVIKINPDLSQSYSHMYGTNSDDVNQFHSMIVRRDYGLAFAMNVNNSQRNGTLNPVLLLLDQEGQMPAGCSYNFYGMAQPQMQVSANNTFQWQNYSMTSANVPLDVQPIDLSSASDDPTSTNYCVN